MTLSRVDLVFGTRPEWLKLYPVYRLLRSEGGDRRVRAIFTGQQPDLVRPLLERCGVEPEVSLPDLPRELPLNLVLAKMLEGLDRCFAEDTTRVVVQGDTLSTFAGSLAAWYRGIPVAHVEAGLRTRDLHNPWPEELHRKLITTTADVHYCPTPLSRENLLQEGVPPAHTLVTGNTSMDTLRLAGHGGPREPNPLLEALLNDDGASRRDLFLVTLHRRENLPLLESDILPAFRDILSEFEDLRLAWVLHPGPSERLVREGLQDEERVTLLAPLDYLDLIALLPRLGGVFTDSGGLSEECAALGVPALIIRQATERVEALRTGNAALVGNRRETLRTETLSVLRNRAWAKAMSTPSRSFGDGFAANRIVAHLLENK
jgi:UDP-N-acetylglucosamine 2-epimerase (non-hydrolysing)